MSVVNQTSFTISIDFMDNPQLNILFIIDKFVILIL